MESGPPQILVVDDDRAVRDLVVSALSSLGYRCGTAADGREGLAAARRQPPSLLITDLEMPFLGGIGLIEGLRSSGLDIPVIIMTAHADVDSARKAIRLGVSDYLVKPFDSLAELQASARRAVEKRTRRTEETLLLTELDRRLGVEEPRPGRDIEWASGGQLARIAGYRIRSVIGEGGMGTVYKALQVSLNRIVAVKVLNLESAGDPEFIQRFVREARVAARLDHPHIVRGIDAGVADGRYYFAMEYVEGESAEGRLRRVKKIPEKEALGIGIQVASALEHAWEVRLIHRDVKPGNILLARDGTAKLADLGLARYAVPRSSTITQRDTAVGTPAYMSPEQAVGAEDLDVLSDLYSLGCTIYHMVTGVLPFSGDSPLETAAMRLTEKAKPACQVCPDVSPYASAVLGKMMCREKKGRYGSPEAVRRDLERARSGE